MSNTVKTLEEVMAGSQTIGSYSLHTVSKSQFDFIIRAANAFPALVKFVEGSPCQCVLPGTIYWRNEFDENNPPKCPRCALLEKVLR